MDFLKDLSFSESDINAIINCNDQNIIKNFELNQINVIEITRYLFEIGLNQSTIKELFMKQVNLFFKTLNEIKMTFDEYELDTIIKSLNFDVNNVELIDFV